MKIRRFVVLLFFVGLLFSLGVYIFLIQSAIRKPRVFDLINEFQIIARKKNLAFRNMYYNNDDTGLNADIAGCHVILSTEKNPEEQISSLQKILKSTTMSNKSGKIIDFRFDKIVIK